MFQYEKRVGNYEFKNQQHQNAAFAAMLAVSASACKKSVQYVPLASETVEPEIVRTLDSMRNEGTKITSNPEYINLGCDTLKLNKDFAKNPGDFMQKAGMILNDKYNDKMCILNGDVIYDNVKRIGSEQEFDMYINKTPVISSHNLYTTDSKTVYVQIEYYGQVNPKIQNFL